MHPLHWRNRWREESTKSNLILEDKIRSEPHTPADTSRKDKRTTTETSEGPDSGTTCVIDDPRRGARLKNTESKEIKTGPSNTSPTRKATNDNMSDDLHTPAGREADVKRDNTMSQEMGPADPDITVNDKMSDAHYTSIAENCKDKDQPDSSMGQKIGPIGDSKGPDH